MKSGDGAREDLLDRIEDALARHSTGFHAVDRALKLDGERVADLAGFLDGRPCLVLAAREDAGDTLARTLAALECARHAEAIARHLAEVAEDESELEIELELDGRPALVLVVTDGPCERALRERLRLVERPELALFELRRLETKRGASAFVARVGEDLGAGAAQLASALPALRSAPPPRSHALEVLAQALPAERAGLARDLAERLDRIDPSLVACADAHGLRWSRGGELVCRLTVREGGLEGWIAEHGLPHRIESAAAAEVFLDLVLASLFDGAEPDEERAAGLERGDVRERERDASNERPEDPWSARPLLTREEIEAFHQ